MAKPICSMPMEPVLRSPTCHWILSVAALADVSVLVDDEVGAVLGERAIREFFWVCQNLKMPRISSMPAVSWDSVSCRTIRTGVCVPCTHGLGSLTSIRGSRTCLNAGSLPARGPLAQGSSPRTRDVPNDARFDPPAAGHMPPSNAVRIMAPKRHSHVPLHLEAFLVAQRDCAHTHNPNRAARYSSVVRIATPTQRTIRRRSARPNGAWLGGVLGLRVDTRFANARSFSLTGSIRTPYCRLD